MMVSQQWICKKCKIQKSRENLYNKKKLAIYVMNQRLFFKIRHFTYSKYCVEFMFRFFYRDRFGIQRRKKMKDKKKKRKHKTMIYVEYIN